MLSEMVDSDTLHGDVARQSPGPLPGPTFAAPTLAPEPRSQNRGTVVLGALRRRCDIDPDSPCCDNSPVGCRAGDCRR